MKTTHLFEGAYYHIGNVSVSKSFMFRDKYDCDLMKLKIDKHLSPYCSILAYSFLKDEFQLVIKLNSREEIEREYLKHNKLEDFSDETLPETTYIIAQAMANLQSGYVKNFNFKYDRKGALMASRYFRHLIESEKELNMIVNKIHDERQISSKSEIWTYRRKGDGFIFDEIKDSLKTNSRDVYTGLRMANETGLSSFFNFIKADLRGHFINLPPKKIEHQNQEEKLKNLVKFILIKV